VNRVVRRNLNPVSSNVTFFATVCELAR